MRRALRSFLVVTVSLAGCEVAFPAGDLSTEARGDDQNAPQDGGPDDGGASGAAGSNGAAGFPASGGTSGKSGASGASGASGNSAAGFPATECMPGDVAVVGTCDKCGKQRKHCDATGTWQAPVCESQGECAAGDTDTATCGNCGTKKRTCSDTCSWGSFGACGGEGPCAPGQTQQASCDPCSEQTCGNDCKWKGCALKPGSQCEWHDGMHFQCCGGGKWQFCAGPAAGNACQWNPCAACSGCGC